MSVRHYPDIQPQRIDDWTVIDEDHGKIARIHCGKGESLAVVKELNPAFASHLKWFARLHNEQRLPKADASCLGGQINAEPQRSELTPYEHPLATDDEVNVWREAPDGQHGAWQYQKGNCQGGEKTLHEALYQASCLGNRIRIHDTPQLGISEVSQPTTDDRVEPPVISSTITEHEKAWVKVLHNIADEYAQDMIEAQVELAAEREKGCWCRLGLDKRLIDKVAPP